MNKDASSAILRDRGAVRNVWMQAGSRVYVCEVCMWPHIPACILMDQMNVSEFYAGNKNMLS